MENEDKFFLLPIFLLTYSRGVITAWWEWPVRIAEVMQHFQQLLSMSHNIFSLMAINVNPLLVADRLEAEVM